MQPTESELRAMRRWRTIPGAFEREALGLDLWAGQMEITKAINEGKRRISIRSGNGLGKTFSIAAANLRWPSIGPGQALSTAPTATALKQKLWQEMAKHYKAAAARGFPLGGEFFPDSCAWKIQPKWGAYGSSPKDPDSFQGEHGARMLLTFDEAQGVAKPFWDAAEGMMSDPDACWIVIGNPLDARGEFYRSQRNPALWHIIHLDALDHPNVVEQRTVIPGAVSHVWVKEMLQKWGEHDPRYIARVRGNFPEQGSMALISPSTLEKADKEEGMLPGEGWHLGVDVARSGGDLSVICWTFDNRVRKIEEFAGQTGNSLCGHVIAAAEKCGIRKSTSGERIHVDSIGVGASVVDGLEADGWDCDPVCFSESPRGMWEDYNGDRIEFLNLRAEAYWSARELLAELAASVPPSFGDLWEELTEPSYEYLRSKVKIESKDKIKARMGRSPDAADAFVLSLCRSAYTALAIY